jgi:hypothetical protein
MTDILHVVLYLEAVSENRPQAGHVGNKGIYTGGGGEGATTDFDGRRDPVDKVVGKLRRGVNYILQFLFIARYQPYFAIRTIQHTLHGIEDFSSP